MQDDTTNELDIVMNHIPCDFIATSFPMVLIHSLIPFNMDEIVIYTQRFIKIVGSNFDSRILYEPASCGFHNGEGFRKYLIESRFNCFILILYQFIGFGGKLLLLPNGNIRIHLILDISYPFLEWSLCLTKLLLKFFSLSPQLVV